MLKLDPQELKKKPLEVVITMIEGMAPRDLDGDGKHDLIIDFGSGVWVFYKNSLWRKLHPISAQDVVTAIPV